MDGMYLGAKLKAMDEAASDLTEAQVLIFYQSLAGGLMAHVKDDVFLESIRAAHNAALLTWPLQRPRQPSANPNL